MPYLELSIYPSFILSIVSSLKSLIFVDLADFVSEIESDLLIFKKYF